MVHVNEKLCSYEKQQNYIGGFCIFGLSTRSPIRKHLNDPASLPAEDIGVHDTIYVSTFTTNASAEYNMHLRGICAGSIVLILYLGTSYINISEINCI